MNVSLSQTREAQALLRRHFSQTRLVACPSLAAKTGAAIYAKLESDLPTGSFKARGALYTLAVNLGRRRISEVVASSTGNHGAAVAFAAKLLGVSATIFLPTNPNPVKRARIAAFGAKIVEEGIDISAAFDRAAAASRNQEVFFLNDPTDPDLPAATGTIALEIFDQLPKVDTIVVPIGDTALIRGVAAIAKQLNPIIRIIGVQAEQAPSYFLSWKQGKAVSTETCATIADGLATRTPETENVLAIRDLVDEVVLVSDDEMLAAIQHLALEERIIAEPAGAAATAALLFNKFDPGRETVLLVTGTNIAPELLRKAICSPHLGR